MARNSANNVQILSFALQTCSRIKARQGAPASYKASAKIGHVETETREAEQEFNRRKAIDLRSAIFG